MYFVIAILAVLTVALICYAIYLRWKSSTSKIRFALVVIGAMSAVVPTTIIALEQVRIVDLVSATINWIRTGTFEVSPVEGPAQIANYILIFALSYITLRSILIFSNNVFTNWHGRATAVDVALAESKQRPTVATVAAAYVRLRATGRHDVEVDPDTIGREFELSDPPPSPGWNRFARELVLAARRGLDLPENGWAPQLGAWFGFLNREPIAMVALRDWPFPQVEGTLDRIAASRADITRILICVDRGTASVDPSFIYKSIPTDVFYKDQLLFGSLYLQDYCNELIDRYESDDVFVAGHSLSSMFVRPRVKENDAVESQDLLRVISDWERSPGRTHLSLLGQFGQGKSTAALAFCAAWAKRYQRDPAITERVPLLIPLRGRDLTAFTPQELLAAWGDQFQLSGRTLLNLVIAGRATLFFEGFDEINNAGVQSSRARQFNRLWNFAYPAAKLVLTGRTNFFLDTDELRHLLREDESQAPIANINSRVLTLELFNRDEVAEALRAFPSEDRNEIVSEFDRNANFRDIASRPSILPLIASIWKSIVSQTGSSNTLTSAGIIDKYVHAEYGRKLKAVEDDIIQSGGRRDESYMKIPLRIKEFYMMCVARNMARSARPNSISNDELSTTVAEATKYAEAYVASRTSLPEELDYFKVLQSALAENEPEAMERTVSEIRTTGLLADDLAAGAGRLHFPHRQFYEYYLARFCIVACDARLARQQSESFNRFLSTTRPCAVLSREKQAMKFFAELANPAWFQSVFTTTKMKQARMAISAVAAIVVPSSAGLRRTSIVEDIRRVSQSMETFDLGKIGTGALGAVAIIVLMSITTYFAVHYTLQTLGLLSIIGAYGWSAFVLANSTSVIADVAQWCRIAREKFGPLEAMEIQERALGKVTFRAWRLLVTRGASIGIQLESDNRSD